LADGQSISISTIDGGLVYQNLPSEGYYLKDESLNQKIIQWEMGVIVPAEGVVFSPKSPRLSENIYVTADYIPGTEASMELYPTHPEELRMDGIKVETVPLADGRLDYQLTLSEQIGTTAYGSPGTLCPGEWYLVVRTELHIVKCYFTILE